jgi:hypothetical protein
MAISDQAGYSERQSGFHFSRFDECREIRTATETSTASILRRAKCVYGSAFVNLDLRFSKRFDVGERVQVQVLFELFNVLNRQNPAPVQNRADSPLRPTLRPSERRIRCCQEGRSGWIENFVLTWLIRVKVSSE